MCVEGVIYIIVRAFKITYGPFTESTKKWQVPNNYNLLGANAKIVEAKGSGKNSTTELVLSQHAWQ